MSSRIRPKAWLSHHRPGTGSFKYHFNVHVHDVVLREGMVVPEGAKFRLVWKRGDKVALLVILPIARPGLRISRPARNDNEAVVVSASDPDAAPDPAKPAADRDVP